VLIVGKNFPHLY